MIRWSHLRLRVGHLSFDALDALAWGELHPARERLAQRHLARCESCRWRFVWVRRFPSVLEKATLLPRMRNADAVLDRRRGGERVILPTRW